MSSSSVSAALLSEASRLNDAELHRTLVRSAGCHLARIVAPSALLLMASGWFLLRVYGSAYAHNGIVVLIELSASVGFVVINWIGKTWLLVEKHAHGYFLMNAFNSLVVIGSVAAFASNGLWAVGLGRL